MINYSCVVTSWRLLRYGIAVCSVKAMMCVCCMCVTSSRWQCEGLEVAEDTINFTINLDKLCEHRAFSVDV